MCVKDMGMSSQSQRNSFGLHMCLMLMSCSGGWRHADTWWPKLFEDHAPVAWDDTHKEYCDLPAPVGGDLISILHGMC
jgi:hypothetical protein